MDHKNTNAKKGTLSCSGVDGKAYGFSKSLISLPPPPTAFSSTPFRPHYKDREALGLGRDRKESSGRLHVDLANPSLFTRFHGLLTVEGHTFQHHLAPAMPFWSVLAGCGGGSQGRSSASSFLTLSSGQNHPHIPSDWTSQRGLPCGGVGNSSLSQATRCWQLSASSGKRSHGGHIQTT